MKLNKILLTAALSLLAASGLMAKDKAKKEEIPGVAAQPTSFFYTGKPYDADLGGYVFAARNYDVQTSRWTSADPSGFPDGANNRLYVSNNPLSLFDDLGLTGKSIAWVFVWSAAPGSGSNTFTPTQQSNAFQAGLTAVNNNMNSADSASGSTTNYLSDGDTCNSALIIARSASDITSAANSYGKIVLFTHGFYNINTYTINVTGMDSVPTGGVTPQSALGGASNIYYATCCNAYSPNPSGSFSGSASTGSLITAAQNISKNYLME